MRNVIVTKEKYNGNRSKTGKAGNKENCQPLDKSHEAQNRCGDFTGRTDG